MSKIESSLKLIHPTDILFHEKHEGARLSSTKQRILEDGFLRNPISVMELDEKKYLLLDGLHRVLTLKELGCNWIPAQIVSESEISLQSWNHLLQKDEWLDQIKENSELIFTKNSKNKTILGKINYPNNTNEEICIHESPGNDFKLISSWNDLVNAYNKDYNVKRIHNDQHITPNHNEVFLQYPTVNMCLIKKVVLKGLTLPSGVTRFIIQGRILNLKVPLTLLKSINYDHNKWFESINAWKDSLRHYKEEVYLVEH
ncbi:ParB N-terminal domain-containing protein [Chengkuizengella sp. SCS-71B]|uniref:ParB N-terminal domain-containing protein n=1 Tax=Chengkuizengella sp. SCS-71B TaxID=3115290 RepID=UPI0032C22812